MRLNRELKTKIIENAVKKATAELSAKYDTGYTELVEEIRVFSFGGEEIKKKLTEAVKQAQEILAPFSCNIVDKPELHRGYYITCKFLGIEQYSKHLYFKNDSDATPIGVGYIEIPEDSPLSKKWRALQKLSDKRDAIRNDVKANVGAILGSCTTVKKLLKVWPESKELIPEQQSVIINLPALPIADINKLLNLKPAKQAKESEC